MPRALKYKEEFYEAYKLHVRGFPTGLIRDSFENPLMETSSNIDAKTINNWKRKYGESVKEIDKAWHWSKSDEADIEKNMSFYWDYISEYCSKPDKFGHPYPTMPSSREMKYISLLSVLAKGVWDTKGVLDKAREYARTEFCVEIGESTEKAMDKLNEGVNLSLWWAKYSNKQEEQQ